MTGLLRRFAAAVLLTAVTAQPGMAQPLAELKRTGLVQITITAEGQAVVREQIEVNFTDTRMRLRIPDMPREADLSSLVLKTRYGDIRLLEWGGLVYGEADRMVAEPSGKGVRVEFGRGAEAGLHELELLVETGRTGRRRFDLIYRTDGLSWTSSYDVLLRGDLDQVGKRLSMDADGWVEIINRTGRTFDRAEVTVIGPDTLGDVPVELKEPGILELDPDSPLADLWRDRREEARTSHIYPLPVNVTIPGAGSVLVSIVSVKRKPVERVLVLRAEEIPTDTFTTFAAPSQIITFQNAEDYGGNRAVPPGPSIIHVGNQKSSIDQQAWFNHTPADGEIRIDMGKVKGLRCRRINRGRVAMAGGGYEQTFELRLENKLDQSVSVVIDEEPPVFNLSWALVRSNKPNRPSGRRLVFNLEIEPLAEAAIQYTVRYALPER